MSIIIRGFKKTEFEKVKIDEWIVGEIVEIEERLNENKKFKNQETGEYEFRNVDEVRFVFSLDGYQYKKYSRWMTRSISDRSNLFNKYLKKIIPDLEPTDCIDLSLLVGTKVRVMYENQTGNDGNVYQVVAQIRPLNAIDKSRYLVADDRALAADALTDNIPF